MFPIKVLNSKEDGFVLCIPPLIVVIGDSVDEETKPGFKVELAVVETLSNVLCKSVWPRVDTELLDSVEEDKIVLIADWAIVNVIS